MILYHGSNQDFNNVDLSKSKDRRDFGKGFYTVSMLWAENADFIADEYFREKDK